MRASLEKFLRRQWRRVGLWHVLLFPLSLLFLLLSAFRRLAYKTGLRRSCKLRAPVIVIGNISVGGTGKTPLTIWLAERLQAEGFAPAIISRGYLGAVQAISPVYADSDPALVGDEPVLIARHGSWPIWVGRDRPRVGKHLLEAHPECNVIICDDGLQHYRLQRDVEIAVVDGEYRFGNGLLLPAGPLREGRSRLKSVGAVVYNGAHPAPGAYQMLLESDNFRSAGSSAETATAAMLKGKAICAVAGIGNPERFFNRLQQMGLEFERRPFPDHHPFTREDLQSIKADVILMTEKDAIKCADFAEQNWWYLPVSARADEALASFILNKLRNLNGL